MSPTTPAKFKKLKKLPTEIRLRIWEFICLNETRSRIIELDIDPSRFWEPSERKSHAPTSLHINHESRTEARKYYKALISKWEQRSYPPGYRRHMIFINARDDILMLDFKRLEFSSTEEVLGGWANIAEICGGVRQLVVRDFDPVRVGMQERLRRKGWRDMYYVNFMELLGRLFGGLERLCVVGDEKTEICKSGNRGCHESFGSWGEWQEKFVESFEARTREDPGRRVPEVVVLPWRGSGKEIWNVDSVRHLLEGDNSLNGEN